MITNAHLELWLPVPLLAYAGRYEVSSHGRFRRRDTLRELGTTRQHSGYMHVGFTTGGKQQKFQAHRIVAEAWLPKPLVEEGHRLIVNHIDRNKANNVVSNLEWITQSENAIHAIRTPIYTHGNVVEPDPSPEEVWSSKLRIIAIKAFAQTEPLPYREAVRRIELATKRSHRSSENLLTRMRLLGVVSVDETRHWSLTQELLSSDKSTTALKDTLICTT